MNKFVSKCILFFQIPGAVPTVLLSLVFIASCSGSKGGRGGFSEASISDAPSDEEVTDPVDVIQKVEVIEEPVAIEADKPALIQESAGPTVQTLNFAASDTFEEGRYKSEHLLIIRASEESCIKLQIRADTDTLQPYQSGDEIKDDSSFCRGSMTPKDFVTDDDETKEENDVNGNDVNQGAALTLMSATPDICTQRLFRVKSRETTVFGESFGLEPVVTKTAWLVYKTDHINVWSDAEIGNPCLGGTPTDRPKSKLLLESFFPEIYEGARDSIGVKHYQNIGEEAEKIYQKLTSAYGDVSDVNANGAVDIFMTPEVNRLNFGDFYTNQHDLFHSSLIIKPQDLKKYDPSLNPESNEAEVVYIWAPDPAGLYKYSQYPTGNSLTSNYLKGYVAQQLMALIIANSHTIQRGSEPEEQWLTEGLSLLASSYMAGNDYSFPYLAEYLSTRHQYLSLTEHIEQDKITPAFQNRHRVATTGYRAMFAWFLHSKLCGTTVEPCAKIRELVDTDLRGSENIENVTGTPLIQILTEFGHSVGIEMAPNRQRALGLLSAAGNENLIFHAMPELQEISPQSPPLTYEQNITADPTGADQTDRAIAGPFPGRDTMFLQPIMPDSSLNIRLAKNSVTFVILTGLLQKQTVTTAFVGKNVGITVLPLGDRDSDSRQIHIEKTSEMAHLDQRPVNLTSQVNAETTYYAPREYQSNFSVDANRDLWIVGSIDNFNINKSGEPHTVGDVDTFNIEIDPCKQDADEAACRALGKKSVLVQVIPRDFEKELLPTLLVTQTRLEMFRGMRFLSYLSKISPKNYEDNSEKNIWHIGCHSSAVFQDQANVDFSTIQNCANAGLTRAAYQTEVCAKFPGSCSSGMPQQAIAYNAYTSAFIRTTNPDFMPPLFDNFLHAGPDGFPYYNNFTIQYQGEEEVARPGTRPFIEEEIDRQFFKMGYVKDLKPNTFVIHPVFAGVDSFSEVNLDHEVSELPPSEAQILEELKKEIATTATISDTAKDNCTKLGFSEILCDDPYAQRALLSQEIIQYLKGKRIVCYNNLSTITSKADIAALCPGSSLTQSGAVFGLPAESTPVWLAPEHFLITDSDSAEIYKTYYQPVTPVVKKSESFCLGNASENKAGVAGEDFAPCSIDNNSSFEGDIREQLNLPVRQFRISCTGLEFATDFQACGGIYGYHLDTSPEKELTAVHSIAGFNGQRARSFTPFPIAHSAGEYIGKPRQLHYLSFEVPTDRTSIIHLMVGGLQESQGKYFLRVKTKNLNNTIRH